MNNNEVCDSALSVGVCLATEPRRSETELQPYQFQEMLRQAWLILSSRGRVGDDFSQSMEP